MPYTLRLYLYLWQRCCGQRRAWLSPLGLTVNLIFAVVVVYLEVVALTVRA